MKKLLRLSAVLLSFVCLITLYPNTSAYAKEKAFEPGDEVIYVDGQAYYLHDVKRTMQSQPLNLLMDDRSTIKEIISYHYVDSNGGLAIVVGEVTNSTYYGDTLFVTLKQTTKWQVTYEESVKLLSKETIPTYGITGFFIIAPHQEVTYDEEGNGTYTYGYVAACQGQYVDDDISTTCTVYGDIY